ncbi:MAG TPA: DUF5681 domain-containing protein [Stellaceae bacterium]|nr:DUF5681 domain-containing protein [Stellaceae bacterium]
MPDTDLQKTGETGAARDRRGRFRKGRSGNPAGRPRGSVNSATRAAMLLLDGEAEALTRKAVELALKGDPAVLRLCLERIVGARRGRPVALDLPPTESVADLAAAMTAVIAAAAQGTITPEEAFTLSQTLESFTRTLDAKHVELVRVWRGKLWKQSVEEAQEAALLEEQEEAEPSEDEA